MYNEAMQSVAQLQSLARCLAVGSKSLTTILENQRKSRNTRVGTVLGTSMTTAAVAVMCPPGLVAIGVAYLGVGVAAATTPYLSKKWFEESSQSEKRESCSVLSNTASVSNQMIRQ
jgi:tartrate dehydratase alpha subunit/fumarate hydratase class I-like protein